MGLLAGGGPPVRAAKSVSHAGADPVAVRKAIYNVALPRLIAGHSVLVRQVFQDSLEFDPSLVPFYPKGRANAFGTILGSGIGGSESGFGLSKISSPAGSAIEATQNNVDLLAEWANEHDPAGFAALIQELGGIDTVQAKVQQLKP